MKSIRYAAAVCAALSFALPAAAQVIVSDPWIRGTVPQQMATGAFIQLKSAKDAKLVEARSPAAGGEAPSAGTWTMLPRSSLDCSSSAGPRQSRRPQPARPSAGDQRSDRRHPGRRR